MSRSLQSPCCDDIRQRVVRAGIAGACAALCYFVMLSGRCQGQAGLLDSLRNWATPTSSTPHPAVAKVFAYEEEAVGRGSGTLIQAAGDYGYLLTNWHVVRDAPHNVEVIFPNDFRSPATVLKTDERWDLALIAIRRPDIVPMPLAQRIPQIGDRLTIAGYGADNFRAATGLCAQFVSPDPGSPFEMIEVAVSARQGDSGGPIINEAGELAAVLFGTGQGMTTGSHVGRVYQFLVEAQKELAAQPAVSIAANHNGPNATSTGGPPNDLPAPFVPPGTGGNSSNAAPEATDARIDHAQIATHLQAFTRAETAMQEAAGNAPEGGTNLSQGLTHVPNPFEAGAPAAPLPTSNGLADGATLPTNEAAAPANDTAEEQLVAATPLEIPSDGPASSDALTLSDNTQAAVPAEGELDAPAEASSLVEQAGDVPATTPGTPAQVTLRQPGDPAAWQAAGYPPHGAPGPNGGWEAGPQGIDMNAVTWSDLAGQTMYDKIKSVFAIIGVIAVAYVLLHINPK